MRVVLNGEVETVMTSAKGRATRLTLRMTAPECVLNLWKRTARRAEDLTEAACRNELLRRLETDQLLFARSEDPLIEAFQAIWVAGHVLLIIRI
jgi:hypothetical protein